MLNKQLDGQRRHAVRVEILALFVPLTSKTNHVTLIAVHNCFATNTAFDLYFPPYVHLRHRVTKWSKYSYLITFSQSDSISKQGNILYQSLAFFI